MFYKNIKKLLKAIYVISLFGFILFASLSLAISILESFTYAGSFLRHFHIKMEIFIYISMFAGSIVSIFFIATKKSSKWLSLIDLTFLINAYIFVLLALVVSITLLMDRNNYFNFVYSKIHLQPTLLFKAVFLSGYPLLVWTLYYISRRIISKKSNFLYYLFTAILLIFTFNYSLTYLRTIYGAEMAKKEDFANKYAHGQVDIIQWIDHNFPITKNVIYWCDQQPEPVEIFTLDPRVIWYSYEGLSRSFLTNCYYGGYGSINDVEQKKDDLLLVSITPCDEKLKGTKADLGKTVEEYLKIVNNNYICDSSEVVPGLYLYSQTKPVR